MNKVRRLVNNKDLTEVLNILTTHQGAAQSLLAALSGTNPEFSMWIGRASAETARTLVQEMIIHKDSEVMIRNLIARSRLETFLVAYYCLIRTWQGRALLLPDHTLDIEKAYSSWLSGDLDEKFYPETDDKESPLHLARTNYESKIKVRNEQTEAFKKASQHTETLGAVGVDVHNAIPNVPYLVGYGSISPENPS